MGTFQTEFLKLFARVKKIYLQKFPNFTDNAKSRRNLEMIHYIEDKYNLDMYKLIEVNESPGNQALLDKLMFEIIDTTIKKNVLGKYSSTIEYENVIFWIMKNDFDLE